jgi:hypothetical protein
MANDIFGLDTQIGGAWQLEGAILHVEGAEELIVTSAGIQYQRQQSKFSPLNQKKKYITTGEANGIVTLGMVVGPSKDIKSFLERYSDPCEITGNTLSIQPAGVKDCDGGGNNAIEFICNGVLLNNINVNVSQVGSGFTVVSAGLSMNFISLQVK